MNSESWREIAKEFGFVPEFANRPDLNEPHRRMAEEIARLRDLNVFAAQQHRLQREYAEEYEAYSERLREALGKITAGVESDEAFEIAHDALALPRPGSQEEK